ncbi:ethanolamine ammonia-lyase reactivating factor EutA [Haliangium sp. UPWRP_2]|uniref:ethanolamine ammonia-lyase reactivating factor EutA n=1 Tax=Haliangium sp. UPWRP_2 TaxID=1931276 RepID=UPI000D0D032B|nr:ethanolamine ammonia-lyase reactivating factor EutA [Haliangium sp. UPWRP_2]
MCATSAPGTCALYPAPPGTYRLIGTSPIGSAQLASLRIHSAIGRELSDSEVAALCQAAVVELEDLVSQHIDRAALGDAVIVFSGGVGELIYQQSQHGGEHAQSGPTAFGDLGGELATQILASTILSRDVATFRPQTLGRTTVCGLVLHNVDA